MREGRRLLHASHRIDQLKLLLSSPKSLAELSQRTGASKRSVQRWIRALVLLGVVVRDETQDDVKRFWIPAPRKTDRPTFGPADLISLELGAMAIGEYGLGLDGEIRDLADRVETNANALRLRDLFRERAVLVSEGRHLYEGREEDWEEVVDATLFSERLELRHRNVEDAFHFDCYGLQLYKRGFYLVGFSHHHQARRTLGFDGLSSVLRLRKVSFERPSDFDLGEETRASFGLISGEPTQVRLRFEPRAARYVRRRLWHPSQRLTETADGLEIELEVDGTLELTSWILGFGATVEVLTPESLRREIRAEYARALTRYP